MDWLDILILILLGASAWKGFRRGFIIELASLVGLVLGIWAGIHLSDRVIEALDLEVKGAATAFLMRSAWCWRWWCCSAICLPKPSTWPL